VVPEVLGHASIAITKDVYGHLLGRLPHGREPLAAAVAGTIAVTIVVAESVYADFKQIVV